MNYQALIFITLFLLGIPLFFKILVDSNIAKFFKQGKIKAIRIFTILLSIILAFLLALSFTYFVKEVVSFFA